MRAVLVSWLLIIDTAVSMILVGHVPASPSSSRVGLCLMAEAEVTAAAAVGLEELEGKGVPTAVKKQKVGVVKKFDDDYWEEILKSAPPVPKSTGPKVEGDNLMQKVKDAGPAGIISYVFWE